MRFKPLGAILALTALGAVAGPAGLALAELPDGATAEMRTLPNTWFVQLKGAPTADGGTLKNTRAEKAAFRSAAANAGAKVKERRAYDSLFNGVSITASREDIEKIKLLPGVAAVWPVAIIDAPQPGSAPSPDLFTAINMTGASIAQNELGLTGKGVKVAVMDTGIDVEHPAFGGTGDALTGTGSFPTARITHGWDFVGDAFNADPASAGYNPTPTPDGNPDDCNGHGTHVAGIVGADDATNGLKGVAPEVTFGAYRVFGCEGSTTADIMVAAMERALADGMHVLNMSIGSSFQWPQYPTALAADRLVNKGMVVVASIGNSGTSGLYAAGAPGLGSKVIGTASFDNSHVLLPVFTISPDATPIGYTNATAAPPAPTSGTLPMARTGTVASTADGCTALPAGSLAGMAALIRRGTCGFYDKALNAQNAGAAAVVLYNNAPGRINPTVAGAVTITIPVVAISDTEGVLIDSRLAAGPVDLTWTEEQGSFLSPTGGLISSFSSYGLSPDLALKPDIGAPGGNIYSAYPLENGGYANISGTSMASPHVAGGVALLLQAQPKTSAQVVRSVLQNSADPKNWWGNPALGFLDNVHRQGAGMVDILGSIQATTRIEPSKLALGESEAGPATRTLTLRNAGNAPVTYSLSDVPALATGPNTFTPGFFGSFATVGWSAPSVTVPAKGTASVDVTITAPASLADLGQYGGYLVFTAEGDGSVLRVPYAGLKGDYQSRQVLVPTANAFPRFGVPTACVRVIDNECINGSFTLTLPASYSMVDTYNMPHLLVHFDHQSRLFRVELFDSKGRNWQREYNENYMPRSSTAGGFFAFPIDGTTFAGNGKKTFTVPDGTYYAKISVLKALGDEANPAHWETWTSPAFVIDRP